MTTAIVILNWNGKHLLEQYLPSVTQHSPEANIYVADNGSTDDSLAFLDRAYPQIKQIKMESNTGYAGGYNRAIQELDEELVVLLNSDIRVTENWLPSLVKAFKEDSQLVAAQPKILDDKRPEAFEYAGAAGGYLDRYGYPFCRGRLFDTLELDQGQYDNSSPVFWASGACLIVRREAYRAVDGLDEAFFAHQEEIDLCWRLQSQGGRVACIPASKVYHLGGATLQESNPRKTYLNFRNSLLLLYKNISGIGVYGLIFVRLCLDGLAAFRFLFQGKPAHFVAVGHAHFGFYKRIPAFRKKRKQWSGSLKYFKIKSLVWQYFLLKRRNFNQLKE